MKKYFNFQLYKESLRQQQLIGWMSFIILALESLIVPMGYVMNGYYHSGRIVTEEAMQMHPLMLGLFAVAPMLVLYQFNFLNSRKACDFYHAIPDRRSTMLVSMLGAALTWCLFLIVSGYGMAIICRLLVSGVVQFEIVWGSLLRYIMTIFAGSFFMAALAILAMSLTGTPFTNFMVMLLIGIAPRAIISIVYAMMYDSVAFIEYDAANLLTNWGYNIPFGMFAVLFSGTSVMRVWMSWSAVAYTMVVGAVYMGLGSWLFIRRKSEAAGRSAVNPLMQAVFRMVIPVCISLAITTAIVMESRAGYGVDSDTLFVYIVFYIVAVVAYLLYELMTTRQWRAVGRAMPGLLVLLGINLAAVLGVNGWYSYQTGFLPGPGEIKQVELIEGAGSNRFVETKMKGVALKNKALCNAIAEEITAQTKAWNEGIDVYYSYDDEYNGEDKYNSQYIFKVKDNHGRTWVRQIWLSDDGAELLMESIKENDTLREKLKDLSGAKTLYFYAHWADNSVDETSGAQELFRMMQQEVQDMPFEDWFRLLMGYNHNEATSIYVHLNPDSIYENASLYLELPVALFPKTNAAFLAMSMENAIDAQEVLLKQLNNPEMDLIYVSWQSNYGSEEDWQSFHEEKHDMEALRQALLTTLTPAVGTEMAAADCIFRISIECRIGEVPDNQFPRSTSASTYGKDYYVKDDNVVSAYLSENAVFFLTWDQYKQLNSSTYIKTSDNLEDLIAGV